MLINKNKKRKNNEKNYKNLCSLTKPLNLNSEILLMLPYTQTHTQGMKTFR